MAPILNYLIIIIILGRAEFFNNFFLFPLKLVSDLSLSAVTNNLSIGELHLYVYFIH